MDDIDALLTYGRRLVETGHRRAAFAVAQALAARELTDPEACDTLGTILVYCGEVETAATWLRRACDASPDNPRLLFNLATAERMAGNLQHAEALLDRVVSLDPRDSAAILTRSDLRIQTPDHHHVGELERFVGQARADDDQLAYALAKELDDLGEHDRSFAHFARGARSARTRIRDNTDDQCRLMRRMMARYNATLLARPNEGHGSEEPIFIIGLPRSGTTLVEQLLGRHPDIQPTGELNALPLSIREQLKTTRARPVSPDDLVDRTLALDPVSLGDRYLEETRPWTGKTKYFTDKLPGNALYVGLLRRVFPLARIILVRRNPIDSCFAMFRAYLTGGYGFTYSLDSLSAYYVAWSELMENWAGLSGDAFLTVHYEQVIADCAGQMQRIFSFLGLDAPNSDLDQPVASAAVRSASASQVRRPIYASSVEKWRPYAVHLQPLIAALRQRGIAVDS